MENTPDTSNILAVIDSNSVNIEKINKALLEARSINDKVNDFGVQLKIAAYIRDIHESITPECIDLLKFLQNKNIGFKTDKESGYADHVVKNCVVEAMIYGLKPLYNEFNILGGNMYTTRQGFERLVYQHPELENLDLKNEPSKTTSGNWKINFKVNLKMKNKQPEIFEHIINMDGKKGNFEYPLHTVMGKATRQILSVVYKKMNNGLALPEGDVSDVEGMSPGNSSTEKVSRIKQITT